MQLYEQFERALEFMPETEQDELLGAWFRYVTAGKEPNFRHKTPRAVFETMRYSMDKQKAGKLGGMAQANAQADSKADQQANAQADSQANVQANAQANDEANGQHNNNNNNYIKEIYKERESACFSEIVEYLNERAGTAYRSSGKKTRSLIHARQAEGFTVEDFKTVIDAKCEQWLGTEMARYLRPETLFGTKFESYLNTPQPSLSTEVEAW